MMDRLLGTCADIDYSALKIVVQDSGLNFCQKYITDIVCISHDISVYKS